MHKRLFIIFAVFLIIATPITAFAKPPAEGDGRGGGEMLAAKAKAAITGFYAWDPSDSPISLTRLQYASGLTFFGEVPAVVDRVSLAPSANVSGGTFAYYIGKTKIEPSSIPLSFGYNTIKISMRIGSRTVYAYVSILRQNHFYGAVAEGGAQLLLTPSGTEVLAELPQGAAVEVLPLSSEEKAASHGLSWTFWSEGIPLCKAAHNDSIGYIDRRKLLISAGSGCPINTRFYPEEQGGVYAVTSQIYSTYIYAAPSLKSKKIYSLQRCTPLTLFPDTRTSDGKRIWYRVKRNGVYGYVREKYIDVMPQPALPKEEVLPALPGLPLAEPEYMDFPVSYAVPAGDSFMAVPIKSRPSSRSRTIGTVFADTTVLQVLDPKPVNGYIKIRAAAYYGNLLRTGYMPAAGVKTVYANSRYGVIVNTSQQRAYFYEYGRLMDVVPCTTGSRDLYTRYGMFLISDRKPFFPGDTSDSTVYYCTQITGRVFFHSVMYSMATGDIDPKSLSQIGVVPASSGCIRLPIDKAKQVYETFPPGTVIIVKK